LKYRHTMATFVYKAIDTQGRPIADTLVAPDRAAAIEQLCGRNLSPVLVERQNERRAEGLLARVGRVSKREVEAFTRQLANLLAAGVPLSRALSILSREASQPAAARLWATVHDQVAGGMSLAEALAHHPRAFPPVYVAMVRAGETGGFLDLVLEQIATFRSREQDLKGKVTSALIYPIILSVLAAGILVFLLTYFIPRFSQMFAEFGGSLPGLTKAIVAVSRILVRYWLVLVLAIALAVFGIRRALASAEGRRVLERVTLRLPLFGGAVARFALVRFCRMLGTLVGAGVPLIAALRVAKEAIGNQVLADTVDDAIEDVQHGTSLGRSLESCHVLFPASVIEMICVAEESSRLDKELTRLATAYEQELDRHLKMIVALAEPALLFIMAVLVGTVVIGMLLPIFNLQELVR
jgi:type II secretory pathway component PulF